MSYSYLAYIDESGDDGTSHFRVPGRQGGSSRWLVISACVFRASRSLESVGWRDEIKSRCASSRSGRDIHFADFSHAQKRAACQILSEKPIKFISIMTRKDVPAAQVFTKRNQLYFYVTRYLVERISWFARDMRPLVREGDGSVKITFSRRGGLSYDAFSNYLHNLKLDGKSSVHWPVIDLASMSAENHAKIAGLQLADCGARAVAEALEPDTFGNVEGQYLNLLKQCQYNRDGNYLSYGLKFLPSFEGAGLSRSQKACFGTFLTDK
jgi:hypothetical protein